MKENIKRYTLDELEREMNGMAIEPYRGRQIFQWLWPKNARSFDDMTNLSKDLRRLLKERYELINPEAEKVQTSADGTRKFRFKLEDGLRIESVFIPEGLRRTICVSTQVGCTLGCKFCATALMGFKRNLKAHEICGQVQAVAAESGGKPTNVVLMGMGEPLLNLEETIKAIPILTSENGLGISHRHITVSTAGIVSGILRLRESGVRVKLAISLNFADDKARREYMPIARSNPLPDLLAAARQYVTGQERVTFEYVLIKGVNDGIRDAGRLAKLLQGMRAKINLIAFNPVPGLALEAPDPERLKKFYEYMLVSRQPVTMRKSHGRDISAACGQLIGKRD
jgi:23S rRNA (adenine2503-C2)-methyltransferase